MDSLITEKRAKILKTYYKSCSLNVSTFQALRCVNGRHNRSSVQGIGRIIKKFQEPISVTDVVRSVHHRNVRTNENNAFVSKIPIMTLKEPLPSIQRAMAV